MRLGDKVPHPIPYQGSKRTLATTILSHVPATVVRLVEPFAGSAAISLAAGQRRLTNRFWLNDAHQPLMNLWDEIVNHPERLCAKYRDLWSAQQGREREYFDDVRELFNRSHRPEHFLYLLARCVKAAIRYNANGEFNNTPDNRRKGARPEEMAARIIGASQLLRGMTTLTSTDYREVLEACWPTDLIYMDPPYQGVSLKRDNRYAPKIVHQEFHDALEELNRRGCLFLVSYDGRTGSKHYGKPLPKRLGLTHLEVCAGRSTQATLMGLDHVTYESLYLSPALVEIMQSNKNAGRTKRQLTLV